MPTKTFDLIRLMKAIRMPQDNLEQARKRHDKILTEAARLLRWSGRYKVSKRLPESERQRRRDQMQRNFGVI